MGECVICKHETKHTATAYVGTPAYRSDTEETAFSYAPSTEYLCASCVQKYISRSFSGIKFYLALQLCWLSVAKYGLFSPFGILGSLISILGLWRLAVLVGRRLHQRFRSDRPMPRILYREEDEESEASDLLKRSILERAQSEGKRVLSLREYRRTHSL